MSTTPTPLSLDLSRTERRLTIRWSTGGTDELPFRYLRGWCPCAGCQGHNPKRRYLLAPTDELTSVTPVGNYAIALAWADGHQTGIYSWDYLYALAHDPEYARRLPKPKGDPSTSPAAMSSAGGAHAPASSNDAVGTTHPAASTAADIDAPPLPPPRQPRKTHHE